MTDMTPELLDFFLDNMEFEAIVETDFLAMAFNPQLIERRQRIVRLACGHKALTTAATSIRCPRCREMLRRSLLKGGADDYEAFRRGAVPDQMSWPDDPMRAHNEPWSGATDIAPTMTARPSANRAP